MRLPENTSNETETDILTGGGNKTPQCRFKLGNDETEQAAKRADLVYEEYESAIIQNKVAQNKIDEVLTLTFD